MTKRQLPNAERYRVRAWEGVHGGGPVSGSVHMQENSYTGRSFILRWLLITQAETGVRMDMKA